MVERQFVALKVVGSNPTIHPYCMRFLSLERFKVKKKKFKKNTSLITSFVNRELTSNVINIKNKTFYKNICMYNIFVKNLLLVGDKFNNKAVNNTYNKNEIFTICLSQKLNNLKTTISFKKNLNTYSIGSILKYFKVSQGKYIRRNTRGVKILLNFLKNLFRKKYQKNFLKNQNESKKTILLSIVGLDYNLINLKKHVKNILERNYQNLKSNVNIFYLINLKISFTKVKEKKIKAIKKRLKKKMLLTFLKSIKNKY